MRAPKDIVDEIEEILDQTNIRHFFIVDDIFNYPSQHARTICKEIIKRKLDIQWTCYCAPFDLEEKTLEVMKKAGCIAIEFGPDSGSDKILKILRKPFSKNQIVNTSSSCNKLGIDFCHHVFFGAPGETPDTMKRTVEMLEKSESTANVVVIGIRIFPYTELAEIAREEGLIPRDDESLLNPTFYIAPSVQDYVENFVVEQSRAHPNWVVPGKNIKMSVGVQKRLRRMGIQGPLWRALKKSKIVGQGAIK
jgi:radical SAM superfamily enzyme YgiQ (UPF0313 family)